MSRPSKKNATSPPEPEGDEPTVREWGDWKAVRCGNWEISVSPDGLLMLPRHLHPREFADFVKAGTHAAKIGAEMIAANQQRAQGDDRSIPDARAIVTEGRPPAGMMPMLVTAGPNQPLRGSIGRRNLSRQPAVQQPVRPRRRG